ncbi:MAG TPA: NAD-dependent epimerase/dehydratase family protein [Rubricoccaceae bacterium]
MRVLFIGGTGVISGACARLAIARGLDVTLLTRGHSDPPEGAESLSGDIRDPSSVRAALGRRTFDAVVDWVAYEPAHVETDLDLFRERTAQYIFIGTASAYETPPSHLPITEATPLANPLWAYSRAKIACEARLWQAAGEENFPVTVVRPSHTYDATRLPFSAGYTIVDRMRRGAPVIVHGDGTSLWTLTHADDVAVGLVGLLGLPAALGEAFHITSSEWLTWTAIYETVARAAGVEAPRLVPLSSATIAAHDPEHGPSLLGDKAQSRIFDTAKIRAAVPDFSPRILFAEGAAQVLAWHDADPTRRGVDPAADRMQDVLVAAAERAQPR